MNDNYKSNFDGKDRLASQWVAEQLVTREAEKNKVFLQNQFWKHDNKWKKRFQLQVMKAASLMKKYSEEAVTNFIKNNPSCFSLLPKYNEEKIQKEQKLIDSRISKNIETEDVTSFKPIKNTRKKNLFGKLNG